MTSRNLSDATGSSRSAPAGVHHLDESELVVLVVNKVGGAADPRSAELGASEMYRTLVENYELKPRLQPEQTGATVDAQEISDAPLTNPRPSD